MSDTKNLRDLILAASDRQKEKAEVPEWGITVFITTMSGTERDAFETGYACQECVGARVVAVHLRCG